MPLKNLLFGFEGRIRRRDWWLATLGLGAASFVAMDLARWTLFGPEYAMMAAGVVDWRTIMAQPRVQAVTVAVSLLSLWPALAINAKRVHDRDKSAVTVMILVVVSRIFSMINSWMQPVVSDALDIGSLALPALLSIVVIGVSLYLLIVLGILDGTPGPNRFGRSPKGIGGDSADKAVDAFS